MLKRLMKEVAELQRGDLSGIGIHIWTNEADIRHLKAMLIGPEGTPYAYCPLLFDIRVPSDYPLVPPHVTILTSDGVTRFHPNLYTQGKVCLSILGTFPGPSWVSTMKIETILKSIYSLLTENPITNEPGWENYTPNDPGAKGFAEWVQYKLLLHTCAEYAKWKVGGGRPLADQCLWAPFSDVIETHWQSSWLALKAFVAKRRQVTQTYTSLPYGMAGKADWNVLVAKIETLEGRALE